MMKHIKEKRGSTLLYVMIIIVILVMVVAVALVATSNANRQSAFGKEYEQTYYSSEAAAQFAAEAVAVKVDQMYQGSSHFYKAIATEPTPADLADFKTWIEGLLNPIETTIKLNWGVKNFDGIEVTKDMVSVEFSPEVDSYADTDSDIWIMYVSSIAYKVKIDGGRVVELEYIITGAVQIESDTVTTGSILEGNDSNGYVSTESSNVYLPMIAEIINNAKAAAGNVASIMPLDSDRKTLSPLVNPNSTRITMASPYAYAPGDLTLGGTVYNADLKYLYVNGNLTINAGELDFPHLKNVFVTGNLTINNEAKLYGNGEKIYDEDGVDKRGNIVGSNFYVKGNLSMTGISLVDIFHCRFFTGGDISIRFNNLGAMNGNSVFCAYKGTLTLTTSGNNQYRIGDAIYAPQFYSTGILDIRANNVLSKLHGIYGSINKINVNGNASSFLIGSIITDGAQGSLTQGMATPIPESSLENLLDIKYGAKKTVATVDVKHSLTGGGIKSITEKS